MYSTVSDAFPTMSVVPAAPSGSGAPEVVYTGGLNDPTLEEACWNGECENPDSTMNNAHVIQVQQDDSGAAQLGRPETMVAALVAVGLGVVALL